MVKLLIVDDSFFVRKFFSDEAEKIPGVEVVATARNGVEALKVIEEKDVNLITLDLKMPEMDGLQTLEKMNEIGIDIPVIVVSSLTPENSEMVAKVLELGAVDVLSKLTEKGSGPGVTNIKDDFRNKIMAFVDKVPSQKEIPSKSSRKKKFSLRTKFENLTPELLIIGGSTGAPPILHSIISYLPDDLALPVVIIQHMQEYFLPGMAKNIGTKTEIPVQLVNSSHLIKGGNIYIPGKNKHLVFNSTDDEVYARLEAGEPVSGAIPSVDVAFQSAADVFKEKVIAVLLTGMGRDGAVGMEKLQRAGARCLGQDRESSVVYGMPGEAAARGAFDLQAPADQIPRIITDWISKTTG